MKKKISSILALSLIVLIISACNVREDEESVTKEEDSIVESSTEITIVDEGEAAETSEKNTSPADLFINYYYANGALAGDIEPNEKDSVIYSGISKEELVPISVSLKQKIHIEPSEELKGKYDLTFESYDEKPIQKILNSNQEVIGEGQFLAIIKPNWNENVDTLHILFESK